jgi:hypothetical protein
MGWKMNKGERKKNGKKKGQDGKWGTGWKTRRRKPGERKKRGGMGIGFGGAQQS